MQDMVPWDFSIPALCLAIRHFTGTPGLRPFIGTLRFISGQPVGPGTVGVPGGGITE